MKKTVYPNVGKHFLVYETWSKLMHGDGVSGTIRTVPGNHYVAGVDSNKELSFRDIDIITKDIDTDEVKRLFENGLIPKK